MFRSKKRIGINQTMEQKTIFNCKCISENGKVVRKQVLASDRKNAENQCKCNNLIPVRITRQKTRKPNMSIQIQFVQTLEELLRSELNMEESIGILSATGKSDLQAMASKIESSIKKGYSFSQAISQMSEYFDPTVSSMLSLSEKCSSIHELILNLRIFLETRKKTKEKLIGALIYPSIVFVSLISFIVTCGFYILPKMQDMFLMISTSESSQITGNILAMKNFSRIFLTATSTFLIFTATVFFMKRHSSKKHRLIIDRLMLRIPLLGKFILENETMKLCFSMETICKGNRTYAIDEALKESEKVMKNLFLIEKIEKIRNQIIKGTGLRKSFGSQKIFPKEMELWLSIGENSADQGKTFEKLRIYFQEKLNRKTENILKSTEPAITLVTGACILTVVVKIVVPTLNALGTL